MVRGFAPNGFGRATDAGFDHGQCRRQHVLGDHRGAAERHSRHSQEYGLKGSLFVDAGTVFGYSGPTTFGGQTAQIANKNVLRSSSAPA